MLPLLQKGMQPKLRSELQEVCLLESRDAANKSLDILLSRFSAKYNPAAMKKLEKNREERWHSTIFPHGTGC
ncbi:MAG: hypothetical protein ACTS8R_08075 [Arsenophonus sp. NC-QC1-MAG3]